MSGTFFVTGASGFVGRHLCHRLRREGHAVQGLVRSPQPELEGLGVDVVHGELLQPEPWKDKVRHADYFIHCAANAGFRSGSNQTRVNVEGTRTALAAARATGPRLRRFVFVSTIGAIDRAAADNCDAPLDEQSIAYPSSHYGTSKLRAEKLVRESGLPYAIVRPAMVVGADMRLDSHFAVFARAALRGSLLARFAWPGKFSVVHVDDLVEALLCAATNVRAGGKTFFCAGEPVALAEFFSHANPETFRVPLGGCGALARFAAVAVPFRLKALLLPALTASDHALRELGWLPRVAAREALREVIGRERARTDPRADPGGQTIITGAASGLGHALVQLLAAHRRNLLLVDRDRGGLARLHAEHPHARIHLTDLGDEEQVAVLTGSPAWRAHPVRELYACAGLGIRGATLATSSEAHARMFKVNVLTRLALAHAAMRDMVREQFGRVVFISSSSAFQPLPWMASYAASNAALLSLGEAWAAELEGTGVHLLTVCPGGMQTNFQASAGVKQVGGERLMPPEDVAAEILRALAEQKHTAIISARSRAMSLLARVLPRGVSVALWKRLMERLR